MQPKPGETWDVKIFNRTYWSPARVVIVSDKGPQWGWMLRLKSGIALVRSHKHVKFLNRVQHKKGEE